MMEIQLPLVLSACIVYFGSTTVQPHNQIVDRRGEDDAGAVTSKTNDQRKTQENFRNLFDSMAKNDAKKSEIYSKILEKDVARNQEAFNAMNEDLRIAQNKNVHKRMNFYYKNDTSENILASKRETSESNYTAPKLRAKDLERDYVHHFGKNYSNVKGEWELARNCTEGEDMEVKCVVPTERNMLCEICEEAAKKNARLIPYSSYSRLLLIAEFFQGNLTFQKTKYRHEMRIDIIKCNYEIHAEFHNDVEIFFITRGKEEKSAYYLDSFYSFNEVVHYGFKYHLRPPYVTWN